MVGCRHRPLGGMPKQNSRHRFVHSRLSVEKCRLSLSVKKSFAVLTEKLIFEGCRNYGPLSDVCLLEATPPNRIIQTVIHANLSRTKQKQGEVYTDKWHQRIFHLSMKPPLAHQFQPFLTHLVTSPFELIVRNFMPIDQQTLVCRCVKIARVTRKVQSFSTLCLHVKPYFRFAW